MSSLAIQANEFLDPLVNLWNSAVLVLPGIIVAIIIGVIGYLIAFIIGSVIKIVLTKAKLDSWIEKAQLSKAIGHIKVSGILGELAKWYVFIIFLQQAVDVLHLGALSSILGRFVLWLPDLIAAVLVLILGLLFAHFVYQKIVEHAHTKGVQGLGAAVRWVIITIAVIIGMGQIGVNTGLLENVLMILIGALAVGFALAIGLSFGLGNKKEANEFVRKLRKNL